MSNLEHQKDFLDDIDACCCGQPSRFRDMEPWANFHVERAERQIRLKEEEKHKETQEKLRRKEEKGELRAKQELHAKEQQAKSEPLVPEMSRWLHRDHVTARKKKLGKQRAADRASIPQPTPTQDRLTQCMISSERPVSEKHTSFVQNTNAAVASQFRSQQPQTSLSIGGFVGQHTAGPTFLPPCQNMIARVKAHQAPPGRACSNLGQNSLPAQASPPLQGGILTRRMEESRLCLPTASHQPSTTTLPTPRPPPRAHIFPRQKSPQSHAPTEHYQHQYYSPQSHHRSSRNSGTLDHSNFAFLLSSSLRAPQSDDLSTQSSARSFDAPF
jgi:hypothetical protein